MGKLLEGSSGTAGGWDWWENHTEFLLNSSPGMGKEVGEASGKTRGMEKGEIGEGKLARPENL